MTKKLLVFDSHPVQYRVPIWQAMERISPGSIHVAYASDCSVRGYTDKGFNQNLAWDEPLLQGYENTILDCENGKPLTGWNSLTGKGVMQEIERVKPVAVLLTGMNYRFDLTAYLSALSKKIPVWLRCETQDQAVERSKLKSAIRAAIYEIAYLGFDRFFYIGELNKNHYLAHKVKADKLSPARYGTVNRFVAMTTEEKDNLRCDARRNAQIDLHKLVIGFSGKFINKKNPTILFQMLEYLPESVRGKTHLYFLGSGELEGELQEAAEVANRRFGVKSFFAGFINQSRLPPHYLAMDIMVLPSRKMGETWGLVANEAMQAGCSVIVSDAVGCSIDFKELQRFEIFKEGNAKSLSDKIVELAQMPRSFDWANFELESYSIEATAITLINQLKTI